MNSLVFRLGVRIIVFSVCLLSMSCLRQDDLDSLGDNTTMENMLRVAQDSHLVW